LFFFLDLHGVRFEIKSLIYFIFISGHLLWFNPSQQLSTMQLLARSAPVAWGRES